MLYLPSESCAESDTIPNGALGSVVPETAAHPRRQSSTSFGIMQPYPDGVCAAVPELPWSPPALFSPWWRCQNTNATRTKHRRMGTTKKKGKKEKGSWTWDQLAVFAVWE